MQNNRLFTWLRRCLLLLCLASKAGIGCYAQRIETVNLDVYRPREGLSSGIITSILQDRKGFMWFGTINGLNRFDGYKFTVYRNTPGDATSIAENYITALFEDSRQRMFVGTSNGALDLFDRARRRFVHCADLNFSTVTRSIVEDAEGAILVTRGATIYRLNEAEGGLQLAPVNIKGALPADYYRDWDWQLKRDGAGNIYVLCPKRICLLRKASADSYELHELLRSPGAQVAGWLDIAYDSVRRKVLLATPFGVAGYEGYNFSSPDTIVPEMIHDDCWSVDRKGAIWYLGKGGLTRIGPSGNTTLIKAKDPLLENFLSSRSILFWDKAQNLWMGSTGYGIAKYSPLTNRFHTVLSGQSIHNMYQGPSNDFYVGQQYRVVINVRDTATVMPLNIRETNGSAAGTPGTLWTVFGNRVIRTDVLSGQKTETPFNDSGLSANKTGILNFDRHGRLWMAFWTCPALASFDTVSHRFTTYHFPSGRTYSGYNYVQSMLWDDSDRLWLNTAEGLLFFTSANASWRRFPIGIKRGTAVNPPIIALCNDPQQPARYLWLGTNGNGLWKLDKLTGSYTIYNQSNYTADNTIYGIVADNNGVLWMSSGHGLAAFNPATGKTATYDKSDGLQDDEFNWTAAVKLSDGTLAFGGLYGINYFSPAEVGPLPSAPVTLTGLKLFNEPVYPGDSSQLLKTDISYTKDLRLRSRQNVFTIEFSTLEYYKAAGVNYRYRLEGFDKDWVYAGKNNSVTYTNLDAGTYHFFAEASYSGDYRKAGAELLTITVSPPWWKTWWLYGLSMIAIGLVIYTLYRYRVRQLLNVERLRMRIAQDLHDEIGSTLSTLSIYSKILQQELPDGSEHANTLLDNINQNAGQVMDSVSDIVWSIDTRYDDFNSIINKMREEASTIFDARDCRLHYEFDDSLAKGSLPMDQRKNLYLIYKEALNNILKYAGCANLWITLRRKDGNIELSVRDDGVGFNPETDGSGNGIYNMRDRAAALGGNLIITSMPGTGTLIRLIF